MRQTKKVIVAIYTGGLLQIGGRTFPEGTNACRLIGAPECGLRHSGISSTPDKKATSSFAALPVSQHTVDQR